MIASVDAFHERVICDVEFAVPANPVGIDGSVVVETCADAAETFPALSNARMA
jgi:hypothetical protein